MSYRPEAQNVTHGTGAVQSETAAATRWLLEHQDELSERELAALRERVVGLPVLGVTRDRGAALLPARWRVSAHPDPAELVLVLADGTGRLRPLVFEDLNGCRVAGARWLFAPERAQLAQLLDLEAPGELAGDAMELDSWDRSKVPALELEAPGFPREHTALLVAVQRRHGDLPGLGQVRGARLGFLFACCDLGVRNG